MPTWRLEGEPLPPSGPVDAVRDGDRLILPGGATAVAARIGSDLHVSYRGRVFILSDRAPSRRTGGTETSNGELRAPMPGAVVEVLAAEGDRVEKGARIVVMEAMKTQQILAAPFAGTVASIACAVGEQVAEGRVLAKVEPEPKTEVAVA